MIEIVLNGEGGELDRRELKIEDGVDPFENGEVNAALHDLIKSCVFADGDTITIRVRV
jgi:hypothetical protein